MVDFRYHLVSLISVFLALAVGIVLGAGPLREGISDTLTGQVQSLREDRDRLRAELEQEQATGAGRAEMIAAMQDEAVAGMLTGQRVAIVTLPGASDVEAINEVLTEAGATVAGQATVSEALIDPDSAAFRSTFTGQLAGYLEPAPEADASSEEVLGQAIAQTLSAPADDDAARTLVELLSSPDPAIVTFAGDAQVDADAIVVVGPAHVAVSDAEESASIKEANTAYARVVEGLGYHHVAVLTGSAGSAYDLLTLVREGAAKDGVTTVDSAGGPILTVNLPRALAAELNGTFGHYGVQIGAGSVFAPGQAAEKQPETDATRDELDEAEAEESASSED
ncbi:MAG: copper transporter [Bowdeniella nasicola]|nr:copper transporter [Bowdeniella nasicola]